MKAALLILGPAVSLLLYWIAVNAFGWNPWLAVALAAGGAVGVVGSAILEAVEDIVGRRDTPKPPNSPPKANE